MCADTGGCCPPPRTTASPVNVKGFSVNTVHLDEASRIGPAALSAGPPTVLFAQSHPSGSASTPWHVLCCSHSIDDTVRSQNGRTCLVMRCRHEDESDSCSLFLVFGIRPCPSPEHERHRQFNESDFAGWPSSAGSAAIHAGPRAAATCTAAAATPTGPSPASDAAERRNTGRSGRWPVGVHE